MFSVTLLQDANATVPLAIITIPGGANDRNCGNMCFVPQNINVTRATAVMWVNKDLVPHDIVSGNPGDADNGTLFDSGSIWMGKSFIYDFNDVGTFHYFDKNHPWETGIITVTDDSSIPPNAIRTPNGGWVTPLTQTDNGTKLNIHYEVGTPVYGKLPPPVPNFITQYMLSPLWQFKSGIPISNIQCKQDLSLVIKAEDGTPACIKQESISKLILRGWISTTSSLGQNNTIFGDFYRGIENDSEIVSIKNQTYYMMTATNTTYPVASGMTVKFHQATFSFPYGSQATPGGVIIPFDMTFPDGTTEAYGKITKNPDGSGSGSGIGLGPGPSSNRTVTVLSDHMHPEAGVTMTEDQIKLLVSTDADATNMPQPNQITGAKTNDPFGITALVIYHPPLACLSLPSNATMPSCPPNTFYLKINSNSTAYLLGYNICDDNSCAKNNNLSLLLPINTALYPNYQSIGLPLNLQWKYGDAVNIQLEVSPNADNKTASLIDLGNSTIVP